MLNYAEQNGLNVNDLRIQFINYGKTELVYVLTEPNGERVTILTKQPAVEFGKIKQEAQNLRDLKQVDKKVVAPIDYFRHGGQELYVTPYINQARCVASDGSWGMYIPEPFYRFESFTNENAMEIYKRNEKRLHNTSSSNGTNTFRAFRSRRRRLWI